MLIIKSRKSIVLVVSIIVVTFIGLVPSIIAGRPGGGGGGTGSGIEYPIGYTVNQQYRTTDLDHFRSQDGEIIHWYDGWALSTTIFFHTPSCGAKKGNSVQVTLRYDNSLPYVVLCARIYYLYGYNQLYIYTGDRGKYETGLMVIPNYKSVYCVVFATLSGATNLRIDYLAACYPNVDLGLHSVNFVLIDDIPDPPELPPGFP